MRKLLLFFALIFSINISNGQGTLVGANQIRKTLTLTGDAINALQCDTVNWIATKYDLTTVTGSGIDSVVRKAGNDTVWNYKSGLKIAYFLDSIGGAAPVIDTLFTGLWLATNNYNGSVNKTFNVDSAIIAGYLVRRKDSTITFVTPTQLLSYVPTSRTLTINGNTQDLTANRTWTVTANTPNSLTNGVGIANFTFNGSSAQVVKSDTTDYATASNTGYLKYADWTTFNNKANQSDTANSWRITGNSTSITGGTKLNFPIYWLVNNTFFGKFKQDSSIISLGTYAGYGAVNKYVYGIGDYAVNLDSGTYVDAIGYAAATQNKGNHVDAVGNYAAASNTGSYVSAFGNYSASQNSGFDVSSIGNRAAFNNSGTDVIAIGDSSAYSNSGTDVIGLGDYTNYNNTYNQVIALGDYAQPTAAYQLFVSDSIQKMHIKLNGSSSGYLLTSDGAGNASWLAPPVSISVTTPITLTGASVGMVNVGTTTQVLHGNASGNASFSAVGLTTDVTGILPISNGGTNASSDSIARQNLGVEKNIGVYRMLGSNMIAQSLDLNLTQCTQAINMTSGNMLVIALENVETGMIIHGCNFLMKIQGVYNQSSNNEVALAKWDGAGNWVVVDSTAGGNDSTIWKTPANGTVGSPTFAFNYTSVANTAYAIIFLWHGTATTPPQIGYGPTATSIGVMQSNFTNSASSFASVTGKTTIAHTIAASSLTSQTAKAWGSIW